jgi:hypothetical protein
MVANLMETLAWNCKMIQFSTPIRISVYRYLNPRLSVFHMVSVGRTVLKLKVSEITVETD